MNFNKTIQMCIFDGNPNGRIMCELSNWNGRVYKISRNELNEFSKRSDSEYTGVYFLLGKDDENNDTVYVGEAEKMIVRLKQHIKDKNYWNDCIVVLSKDNILNKAHVKFLENKFYMLAHEAKRALVINGTVPTCSSISEFDEAMLDEFIENAKLLVNTLGYKVFDTIDYSELPNKKDDKSIFILKSTRGADAKGILVPDGFLVLKGSKMATSNTPSTRSYTIALRKKLIDLGAVDENYVFVSDYLFSDPSPAASAIAGRSANGRVEWKTIENKTINDIESEQ